MCIRKVPLAHVFQMLHAVVIACCRHRVMQSAHLLQATRDLHAHCGTLQCVCVQHRHMQQSRVLMCPLRFVASALQALRTVASACCKHKGCEAATWEALAKEAASTARSSKSTQSDLCSSLEMFCDPQGRVVELVISELDGLRCRVDALRPLAKMSSLKALTLRGPGVHGMRLFGDLIWHACSALM